MNKIEILDFCTDIPTLLKEYYDKYKYSLVHSILHGLRKVGKVFIILEMPVEIRGVKDSRDNYYNRDNYYTFSINQKIKTKIMDTDLYNENNPHKDFWNVMKEEIDIEPNHLRITCEDEDEFNRYLKLIDGDEK
jgi:hypothetical protein